MFSRGQSEFNDIGKNPNFTRWGMVSTDPSAISIIRLTDRG
jgi:hypothetical protein